MLETAATPRRGGASLGMLARPGRPDAPDVKPGETYFSQLRRTIETPHVQQKQTADQWLRFLRKGKREVHEAELKHTGLGALLEAKGRSRVTKAEMLKHLDANEIRVEEVTRGADRDTVSLQEYRMPYEELTPTQKAAIQRIATSERRTKFESYTLPGAKNYREVVLTKGNPALMTAGEALKKFEAQFNSKPIPASRKSEHDWLRQAVKDSKGLESDQFTGSHWDEANVLVHLRLSDRTVGGKKTLLVEEIQSDWAQKGRSEGFQNLTPARKSEVEARRAEIERAQESVPRGTPERHALLAEYTALGDKLKGDIPSAPFVEKTSSWTTLGLKRLLKMAADEGYDKVGIVRGQESAEHYDLSKQISEIHYSGSNLKAYNHEGETVVNQTGVRPADLPDYIGKGPAERLMAQKPKGTLRSLVGEDVRIDSKEAKGMKAFYDEIVPQQLNKLGKEFGVKVEIEGGKVQIEPAKHGLTIRKNGNRFDVLNEGRTVSSAWPTRAAAQKFIDQQHPTREGTPIHTMDVPKEMQEKVKRKGFPLVSRNGSLGSLIKGRTA